MRLVVVNYQQRRLEHFMTLPSEYPGSGANDEKRFPVRKGTVVYVHPKGRYIVAECGGVRETFFPEEVVG